ncbi:DNA polymerase III subunit beta [Candidatus Saccharibacteria bacterium]|nr:DNA polymerase III subunit beta [Candidatus Saccharibacteria bacterium]
MSRIAGSRNQLPILNNILLRADDGKLTLIANNLELAVVETLEAKVKKAGVITVPAKPLAEFINNLPDVELDLSATNAKLKVSSQGYNATFNGMDAEEFPEIPELEEDALSFSLSAGDFRHSLQRVIGATSNDFARPALTGVCFSSFDKRLLIAATDGYRLAEIELLSKFNDEIRVIVPASAIQEILGTTDEKDISIKVGESQIQFLLPSGTQITSNLISGSYPDYRQLIPEVGEDTAVVEREELLRLLKVAQVFARVVDNTAVLKTVGEKSQLEVVAVESELGSNLSEMSAAISGKDVSMAFNIRFLIDALSVFSTSEVILDFSDSKLIIRGNDSSSLIYIVMPRKA